MITTGPLATMPRPREHLTPRRRRNRGSVALAGLVDAAVALCLFSFGAAQFAFAAAGLHGSFFAIWTLVDMDLNRCCCPRNIPPGGCFCSITPRLVRSRGIETTRHHLQQRLRLFGRHAAQPADPLPQRLVSRVLSGRHLDAHAHWRRGDRRRRIARRQQ